MCVSELFFIAVCRRVCVCVCVCYPLQLIALLVMTHPCQPTPVSLKRTFQTCYLGSSSSSVPFGHICSMCQGSSLQQGTLCLGHAFLICPVLCPLSQFLLLAFLPGINLVLHISGIASDISQSQLFSPVHINVFQFMRHVW